MDFRIYICLIINGDQVLTTACEDSIVQDFHYVYLTNSYRSVNFIKDIIE